MREDVLAGLEVAAWAPAAASFIFGVGVGWLIFGGNRPQSDGLRATPPVEAASDRGALDALESQIKTARELLDEKDEEVNEVAEQLTTLETSLKRLHARLTAVFRAVRRERNR